MGVLRIKENIEELLEKDPYELFTLDEPHRLARRLRPEFFGAAFLGVIVAFAVAFFTFWNVQQDVKDAADAPYAYFEVKAIDPDGRLIAGALVKERDHVLGVTDSFGEWRRFMRVKPGSTVTLTLAKKVTGGSLTAIKNMAVPMTMPKGGDLELTGSVQLSRGGKAEPFAKTPDKHEMATSEALPVAAPAKVDAVDSSADTFVPADGDNAAEVQDVSRVWVMAEGQTSAALGEVLASVRKRARELGVRIDPKARWRMKLTELTPGGDQKSLIIVESLYDGGKAPERLFSYLRNFQEQPAQTARDILWSATNHMAKTYQVVKRDGSWLVQDEAVRLFALTPGRTVFDAGGIAYGVEESHEGTTSGLVRLAAANTEPCATGDNCTVTSGGILRSPPVPGWQRLKLKVFGVADAGTTVYVSGYEARKIQDKVFEYWGVPMSGANVTAVRGGKLIYRGRIQSGGANLPAINLPSLPLSRR